MTTLTLEDYRNNYDNLELEVEKAKDTFLETMFLDEEEEERLTQLINSAIDLGVYKKAYIYSQAQQEIESLKAQLAQYQSDDWVLVPKKELSTWYLNEAEGLWTEEPDNFLCEIESGQVFTVQLQHNFSLPDEYIARPWSEVELDADHYQVYATKEEAEQVAQHCKAMIEARGKMNE